MAMRAVLRQSARIVAAFAMLSCVLQAESASAAPEVHRIVIEKMAFGAPPQNIHVGDTVEWVNRDIFRHSATASDGSFDVDVEPDATAKIVVKRPGRIPYICKYHPSMKGELIVEKR
jgi:plastocyanin